MKLGTVITIGGGGDPAFAAEMGVTLTPKTAFTNLEIEDYTKGKVTIGKFFERWKSRKSERAR
jgi:hypothetical protein